MEPRKIQKVGKSTLSVSLPIDWANEYGIDKGDNVYLSRIGSGSISVHANPSGSVVFGDMRIVCENPSPVTLERAVVGSYVLGRREIEVLSETTFSAEQTDAVHGAEEQLMGAGIIEETSEKIVLRCSINPDEFDINDLLSRLNSTATSMRSDALGALSERDPSRVKNAPRQEEQANRVFVLILRLLLSAQQNPVLVERIGLEDPVQIIGSRAAAKCLEISADHAETMADEAAEIAELGSSLDDETLNKVGTAVELVDETTSDALESLHGGDMEVSKGAREALESVRGIEEEVMTEAFKEYDNGRLLTGLNDMLSALTASTKEAVQIAETGSNRALESAGGEILI